MGLRVSGLEGFGVVPQPGGRSGDFSRWPKRVDDFFSLSGIAARHGNARGP